MSGIHIKQERTKAGYTVRSLAEKIGVNPNTIACIETDKKTPRADTLRKIANACHCKMDDLWP